MPRELKTAEEIHGEVQRRIDMRMRENEDEDEITASPPIRLIEPDEKGCNWVMHSFSGDQSYRKLVGLAVFETKEIWNLA